MSNAGEDVKPQPPEVMARQEAEKLTDEQRRILIASTELVDGRVLVQAYALPDHLTHSYSVHRSALNRVGLAVRTHLTTKGDGE